MKNQEKENSFGSLTEGSWCLEIRADFQIRGAFAAWYKYEHVLDKDRTDSGEYSANIGRILRRENNIILSCSQINLPKTAIKINLKTFRR